MSEWLDLMLEEISRKTAEQADAEEERARRNPGSTSDEPSADSKKAANRQSK